MKARNLLRKQFSLCVCVCACVRACVCVVRTLGMESPERDELSCSREMISHNNITLCQVPSNSVLTLCS